MARLTDRAAQQLKQTLDRAQAPPDTAVRFVRSGAGAMLRFDDQHADDERLDFDGRTVLVLDPDTAEFVGNRVLDHENGQFHILEE